MRPTAYRRNACGLRDRQALEHVRMQTAALFAAGRSQAEVTHQLAVACQTSAAGTLAGAVAARRRWVSAGPTGQAPRLSDTQLAAIDQALRQGAGAHGFDTVHRGPWQEVRCRYAAGRRRVTRPDGLGDHPGVTVAPRPRIGPGPPR